MIIVTYNHCIIIILPTTGIFRSFLFFGNRDLSSVPAITGELDTQTNAADND